MKTLVRPLWSSCNGIPHIRPLSRCLVQSASLARYPSPSQKWSHPPSSINIADDEVASLAGKPLHSPSLADLVKQGRPPLSADALFASANFTLSLLPIRLAHRIQALRNLPFIVVSNPNISAIYNNYLHSLSTLLPYKSKTISTLEEEVRFTSVLTDLVQTHSHTIPTLARGFLECRKYIKPEEVTRFLDEHLRARIGTRLIAEQHIALHTSSQPHQDTNCKVPQADPESSYIGVIDTALQPAAIINSCGNWVSDICDLKYGRRPTWVIDGEPNVTFAFVPVHLDYIMTELLKNAFRATVEAESKEPVVITIAAEPESRPVSPSESRTDNLLDGHSPVRPFEDPAPGVTIRIRDRGGGISPHVLPEIWSYSFTTFSDDDLPGGSGSMDALNALSGAGGGGGSSIAGLGYGLPLGRAYAEYFGGGIAVQSLYGWGTDVYLRLKGLGKPKS
ncbi:pyruvate dehydrogenase kinase [Diplocarpon rosae]|nr:pyruvate dehydrogenase kinase [Diplocarpon rosae]